MELGRCMSTNPIESRQLHLTVPRTFPESPVAGYPSQQYGTDRALHYCVGHTHVTNPGYKVELFDLSMTQMIPEVRKICIPQLEPGHIRFVWVYRLEHCKPLHAFEQD